MKVPLSWLNDYVDLSGLTVAELSDKLTFSGVEVEGIARVGSAYEGYVVGEVRACEQHPNADRLRLCQVFDGANLLQIVCGAPNVAAGQKVCLATLGAVLPDGSKLKKAKIRGIESFGMLCAEDELGLSEKHEGLFLLDSALQAGTPLARVLPPPETVLELEITWNRSDCLSIIGIAREFAVLLDRPLKRPEVNFSETGAAATTLAAVRVDAPDLCPRYVARVLTGVKDGPSPDWMRRRLELCGVRPISLIVDVTNYVMLECGQPLHAFDYNRVAKHTILVRRAQAGERMVTLDNMTRELDAQTLVIADAQAPVALAGVMGGAGSEIAPGSTDSVLLESATFFPPAVKHASTRLNLKTESSRRFERGVDPDLADWASRRATALLVHYGHATVATGMIDVDNRPKGQRRVTCSFRRCREVIGVAIEESRMIHILEALGLKLLERGQEQGVFEVPSWRQDLEIEADLIEEIARIHGLAALPDQPPQVVSVSEVDDTATRAMSHVRQAMMGLGFTEAMHYSFLSADELETFDPRGRDQRLVLPNPASAEYAVMRDSLLPQMSATLGRNHARQMESAALFEMGRVFWKNAAGKPCEEERLSLGLYGPAGRSALDHRKAVTNEEAALWTKGALEQLALATGAGVVGLKACDHPAIEPGWAAEILLDGVVVGRMGLLRTALRHPWRMTCPMAIAEVVLRPFLSGFARNIKVSNVPSFPAIRRDIAMVTARAIRHEEIVAVIRQEQSANLTKINLFDIFELKDLGGSKRSLAYSLEFRSPSRTLTDDEVNASFQKIVQALRAKLGVEIREG